MNRFGICDFGFRIDEGNVIDFIFLTISYELSPGTESALTRNAQPVTRNSKLCQTEKK
jgi:hypothetical protein